VAQDALPKISRIEIRFAGPATVNEQIIRSNIRSRVGEPYRTITVDDDINSLYATDLFYNIRVTRDRDPNGDVVLTYVVQANPRLTEIRLSGNEKLSDSKIRKKITSQVGEALDERKLFTDAREIEKLYQKKGYAGTAVRYKWEFTDESTGRGVATFEIKESPKVKIIDYEFVGNEEFKPGQLRTAMLGWWRKNFAWLIGYGRFEEEKFDDGLTKLKDFYRDKGFIDYDLRDVEYVNETPTRLLIRLHVFEGQKYRVGKITFEGTTMLPTQAVAPDFKPGKPPRNAAERAAWTETYALNRDFKMKEGDTFRPSLMARDTEAVANFYNSRGYIDVERGGLQVRRVPNVETGTMDLAFKVEEGQKSYIEKIEIHGNTKTKDKVIRRELAVAPGEVFDMTRVKLSKRRLEGLEYFSRVDARPEDTEIPNRKNLMVGVEEQRTGKVQFGAGFSTIDSLVAYTEVTQGNFDLFHPPTFTGGGQKFRAQVQVGTKRQDYVLEWVEPWFMDRYLQLGTKLYHQKLDYQSPGDLYTESRSGVRISLSEALSRPLILDDIFGPGQLTGSIFYNLENVGIFLTDGVHGPIYVNPSNDPSAPPVMVPANAPDDILNEAGYSLLTSVGTGIAYDTRNDVRLPNGGQRTEVRVQWTTSYLGGNRDYYRIDMQSAWYFPGLFKGHVIEVGARGGVIQALAGDTVPFYERYYLGGMYSLRGTRYREVSPRQPGFDEPIGGDTYWFGTIEYSLPLIATESGAGLRFAAFYDIGNVLADPYDFDFSPYTDNWGLGLRLNIPQLGPLRLDFGVPIHYDQYSNDKVKFNFGVGWSRPF